MIIDNNTNIFCIYYTDLILLNIKIMQNKFDKKVQYF